MLTGEIKRKDQTEWLVNGKLHRLDGPAITYCSGTQEWWEYGIYIDTKDNLKNDCSDC